MPRDWPSRQPLVPAIFAQIYLTLAQQRGISADALIRQAGLPPTAFGNLGSAILCCKTMRDVIELAMRFQFLFARGMTVSVLLEDPTGIIDLNLAMPLPEPFRHLTLEITLTCFVRCIALLTHARPDELEVWFACPRPDYPDTLIAQLGHVRFGMPSNQLRFSTALKFTINPGPRNALDIVTFNTHFHAIFMRPSQPDLNAITQLIEANKVKPVIDREFALAETAQAYEYAEKGKGSGKVVVNLG